MTLLQAQEISHKMARWWADHLRNGAKFQALSAEERSSPENSAMALGEVLAPLLRPRVEPAQADAFEQVLERLLAGRLARSAWAHLSVDYGPDATLRAALEEAGIKVSSTVLPWKSWTKNDSEGRVFVRCGYGEPEQEI